MHFVVYCLDRPDMEERRRAVFEAHRAHLQTSPFKRLISGPLTEVDGTVCGSLFLYEGDDIGLLREYVLRDPLNEAGIWNTVDIRPFEKRFDGR